MRKQTTLFPFQQEGVKKIFKFGMRALLADEQGLGKTIQALSAFAKSFPFLEDKLLVICPSSLKLNWQKEAMERYGFSCKVLKGGVKQNKHFRIHPYKCIIVNYDVLYSWYPILCQMKWACVVFDECHYIKNMEIKTDRKTGARLVFPIRTRAALQLIRHLDRVQGEEWLAKQHESGNFQPASPEDVQIPQAVIALSGTPLTNRPTELFPVLSMLRPDLYRDRLAFCYRYAYRGRFNSFFGGRNLIELHNNLLDSCMIRRLKKDVLQELPEKQYNLVPVQIPMEEYNEVFNNFQRWLMENKGAGATAKALQAEALVKMNMLFQIASKEKLPIIKTWIEEFLEEADRKLVVFTNYHNEIDFLHEAFKDKSVVIDGRVSTEKRHEAVESFQNNPNTKLFFGNIKAAGVGLTLTAASDVVFCSLPWTPADLQQAVDRCHRIGQKNSVNVNYILAEKTLDVKLCHVLQEKQKILDSVLDGTKKMSDFNIYDELMEELSNGAL